MNTAITLIGRIWLAIPAGLRSFVGTGIASGIAMLIVVLGWLFWGTGYLQERLGIPTKADVSDVANAVTVASEDQVLAVASVVAAQAIRQYDDSLRQVSRMAVDSVATPMLDRLQDLTRRIRDLERLQGITLGKIDQMPKPDNDGIRALVEKANGQDRSADILEALEALNQRMSALERTRTTTFTDKPRRP